MICIAFAFTWFLHQKVSSQGDQKGRRHRQQDSQGYRLKHREERRREQWQEEGWIRRTAGKRGSLDENRCFCILLHLGRSGAFGVDQDVNASAFGGLLLIFELRGIWLV